MGQSVRDDKRRLEVLKELGVDRAAIAKRITAAAKEKKPKKKAAKPKRSAEASA